MSMNCMGGTDSDQLYSLLTLACSLTRDEKGWLKLTPKSTVSLSCNGAVRSLYSQLCEDSHNVNIFNAIGSNKVAKITEPSICNIIIVKQDASSHKYVNDTVAPIIADGEPTTYVIKVPCAIGRSSKVLRSMIFNQDFHALSDYGIKGMDASMYLNLSSMLAGSDACSNEFPKQTSTLPGGIIGTHIRLDEPTIQLNIGQAYTALDGSVTLDTWDDLCSTPTVSDADDDSGS